MCITGLQLRLLGLQKAHEHGAAPRTHPHRRIHEHHLPLIPLQQREERGRGIAPRADKLQGVRQGEESGMEAGC